MAKLAKKNASKPKFKYRPSDPKLVKERAEQTGGRFDSIFKGGFDVFKPKVGDNAIRFLPRTWDEPQEFSYPVWVHKYVGPDNSTYLCPRKMEDGPCAVCEAARESKEAGEDDEAKQLEVAKQYVAWIIDRNGDEDTPMLYLMSWTIDKDLAALRLNKHGGLIPIDNPEVGFDVSFKRTGQGLKTRYSAWAIDREESPLSDDDKTVDELLEYIEENPIPDVLNQYDNDYLEKVMSGKSSEKDEDDSEDTDDEKPRKRRGREAEGEDEEIEADKRSRRRRDAEEDADDGSEDEDEKPSRRSVPRERLKARGKPDDDDGEEDTSEDEDEPKPRRGRSRDDDDEDDEKPRRGKSKSRNDDDDTDDDDAPSDDDDDKPARRSSRGRR